MNTRNSSRIQIRHTAEIGFLYAGGKYTGEVANRSIGGLAIRASVDMPEGAAIFVTELVAMIENLPGKRMNLNYGASIVRKEATENPGEFLYGLQFLSMNDNHAFCLSIEKQVEHKLTNPCDRIATFFGSE